MVLIGDKERGHRVLFIKLGLLTCVFYVVLMTLLEAGLWALVYFKGFMWYYSGKHPGFALGTFWGTIFGVIWLMSFCGAWLIVCNDLKSRFPISPN